MFTKLENFKRMNMLKLSLMKRKRLSVIIWGLLTFSLSMNLSAQPKKRIVYCCR